MRPDSVRAIRPLLTRIKYGVKDELIDLVSFRGVGRTRARTLYNAGYRKRSDIMSADENKLASLPRIGPSLAKSLKNQAGGSVGKEIPMPEWDPEMEDLDAMSAEFNGEKVSKQSNIFDF